MAIGICNPSTSSLLFPSPPAHASPSTRSSYPTHAFRSWHVRQRRCRFRLSGLGGWVARPVTRRGLSVRCGVTMIDQSRFGEEVLASDQVVLVEFVANWCGPCRLIAPVVDWASQEYKDSLKVVKIDHDANPRLIEEYKVYGLPTLILFKDGKEVPESRREGAITKVKLKEYLDSFLKSITIS